MSLSIPNHLLPNRTLRADYARATHFFATPPGVTAADVANPEFWQHVAPRFTVNDLIEVVGADFDMELRVVAIDSLNQWAIVRPLRLCGAAGIMVPGISPADVQMSAGADIGGYRIEHGGPQKWRIVRGRDVIDKGYDTREAAEARLAEIKGIAKVAA